MQRPPQAHRGSFLIELALQKAAVRGGATVDRARRHLRRLTRGQALVEMAIVSLVLLLLFATVLDFGRLFYSQITVENAARAGSLVAAQTPSSYLANTACTTANSSTNRIGCAVQRESRGSMVAVTPSEVVVTCETNASPPSTVACQAKPQSGIRSRVSVNATFGFLMPVISIFLGDSVTISASVAANQQKLPASSTFLPTAAPTSTPTPTPTPTSTATATPTPTVAPTPVPCPIGQAYVPDLVNGATGVGTPETVAEARAEWLTAGFAANNFTPSNGQTNKQVLGQWANATVNTPLAAGVCQPITTRVWVTYGN